MIFNNATFNRVGRNTYNREHAPWRQIFNLSFLDQFKPRHFSNKRFTIRGENVPPMKLLFLPRPGEGKFKHLSIEPLSPGEKFPRIPRYPILPILPFFFFTSFHFGTSSTAETGTRRRGGARLEFTVKGRENCARWPFRNTMEINLSSLTNLRGHKATEDRGIALIITRSVLEDSRGFPRRGGEKKKKEKLRFR